MRPTLAIARREIDDRLWVFGAALIVGLLPIEEQL